MSYRSDIDGLRAIAVLGVVIYHVKESWLPGGFLGVDVFFVISGFLVTTSVTQKLDHDDFRITDFYSRRVRRLMPAFIAMLVVTSLCAALLLLPRDLTSLGQSLLAALGMVGNVWFWMDSGYFTADASTKPLLHTWSLGVEEQFYLLLPLFLIVVYRYARHLLTVTVIVLVLSSYSINVFLLNSPGADAAFYLLPARAWELGIGVLVALARRRHMPQAVVSPGLVIVGICLIAVSFLDPELFGACLLVPAAVPAVLGTAFVVCAGFGNVSLPARWLSIWPLREVGRASYSIYLLHWPLLILAQYYTIRALADSERVVAAVVGIGLGMASSHFIERPFRQPDVSMARIWCWIAPGLVGLAAFGSLAIFSDGWPQRLGAEARVLSGAINSNHRCMRERYFRFGSSRACGLSVGNDDWERAEVVLFGNSHAQMFAPAWQVAFDERGLRSMLVPLHGCLPTLEVNISVKCAQSARAQFDAVVDLANLRAVVVVTTWHHGELVTPDGAVVDNQDIRAMEAALLSMRSELARHGVDMVLAGPIAIPGFDVASMASRSISYGREGVFPDHIPRKVFDDRYSATITRMRAQFGKAFATPHVVQCSTNRCEYLLDGRSLFADESHVAVREVARFEAAFAKSFSCCE